MKKKLKLIPAAIAALTIILLFAACGEKNDTASQPADLNSIIEKLYQDIDVPPNETIELDKDNFEFFAFIPYGEGLSGAAADALVNITPHSLVVIRTEDGNGAELAKQVAENADPNKWLCVRADSLRVAYTDHYVVLVMSFTDTADAIIGNFKSIAKDIDGREMTLLSSVDYSYE